MSGCIIHGSLAGKNPYLSKHEEEELLTYLATCSKVGYPKKRDEIIGIVQEILHNKNGGSVEGFNGRKWWMHFMERWPQLALRKGDALAQCHANAVTSN